MDTPQHLHEWRFQPPRANAKIRQEATLEQVLNVMELYELLIMKHPGGEPARFKNLVIRDFEFKPYVGWRLSFENCTLINCTVPYAYLRNCTLNLCNLSDSHCFSCKVRRGQITHADLYGGEISNCDMDKVVLSRTRVDDAEVKSISTDKWLRDYEKTHPVRMESKLFFKPNHARAYAHGA